jgi:hypothetical protein
MARLAKPQGEDERTTMLENDVVFQLGSMLGRIIPLAMAFVAVTTGFIMVFDAVRLYRNRETIVADSDAQPATHVPVIAPKRPATAPRTVGAYAYTRAQPLQK